MNNKTLLIGLITFGLLITALITRSGEIAWMLLPFLAYLGVGILQTPAVEQLSLVATRRLEETRANGKIAVAVTVSVQNQGVGTVCLLIAETAQPGMEIIAGELERRVSLRPGEAAELKYTFSAARGNFSWKHIRLIVSDPLGVIETERLLPASTMIQIRPQVKKFKTIQLRPRSTLHSPGSIPARLGGRGTDFFGVREYHPGDPLRWLDWRLTARHPRKFFTKEFEQEEIAEIGLILDARQSSELQIGAESLFEKCVGATGSLAEMFLHQGHRVSLLVFGETMSNVFPGYGKMQLQRVMNCLARARVGTGSRMSANLNFLPIRMFPKHALVIVISPLSSTDRSLFHRLRAYGYQALLICPDTLDFAIPTLKQDLSNQLALRAARLARHLQLREIAQLQIPVIDWKVSQPLFPLVRNALTRSRGQREV